MVNIDEIRGIIRNKLMELYKLDISNKSIIDITNKYKNAPVYQLSAYITMLNSMLPKKQDIIIAMMSRP